MLARDADLVLVVGSRLSDFTTASKTAFQHPDVRFINDQRREFDAAKHAALPLVGDARATLERADCMRSPVTASTTRIRDRVAARLARTRGKRRSSAICAVAHCTALPSQAK